MHDCGINLIIHVLLIFYLSEIQQFYYDFINAKSFYLLVKCSYKIFSVY